MKVDCAIIGGGIVGLSVGYNLLQTQPGVRVVILEKEADLASHQSGHNSGVIHSGIYYPPGSLKARLSCEGNRSMRAFCSEYGIPHEVCGKIIVATAPPELSLLENLYHRARANGLEVSRLTAEEAREIEPRVRCLAGLRIPSTAIVSFRAVCEQLASLIRHGGGTIVTNAKVTAIRSSPVSHYIESTVGNYEVTYLVNCAGLQSDRIAAQSGQQLSAKIIPFRGEYYELVPERRHLVRGLIYPVPNPEFPFLGVHFTRMIGGSVHAGPNAVLAFKREGYRKADFNLRDFTEMMTYRGLWKLGCRCYREAFAEMRRSLSKKVFVRSLQQLIPEIKEADLIPAGSGVRAQALLPDGSLVNDFLLARGPNSLHVCNAPSPAATASLEIGKEVVSQLPHLRARVTVSVTQPISAG